MKAIILAAGKGTRLRPLTNQKPKCLVELADKSLLDHQIEVLNSCEISDIHVVGGYLSEQLVRDDCTLHLNDQYATTNMVHTLFCGLQNLESDSDTIIAYGDIVYQRDVLLKMISAPYGISLAIDKNWLNYWKARMDEPLDDAETLVIGEGNKIIEIGKKPRSLGEIHGQYTGLIKISGDYLKKLKNYWLKLDRQRVYDGQDFNNMYMTSLLQNLIDNDWDVRAVNISNGWAEIDTPGDLKIAPKFWRPL